MALVDLNFILLYDYFNENDKRNVYKNYDECDT